MKKAAAATKHPEKSQRTITFTWHCLLKLEEGTGWEKAKVGRRGTFMADGNSAHFRGQHPDTCPESIVGLAIGWQSIPGQRFRDPTASISATLSVYSLSRRNELGRAGRPLA